MKKKLVGAVAIGIVALALILTIIDVIHSINTFMANRDYYNYISGISLEDLYNLRGYNKQNLQINLIKDSIAFALFLALVFIFKFLLRDKDFSFLNNKYSKVLFVFLVVSVFLILCGIVYYVFDIIYQAKEIERINNTKYLSGDFTALLDTYRQTIKTNLCILGALSILLCENAFICYLNFNNKH